MDVKTKLRSLVVLATIVGVVFAYTFISSVIETVAVGYGPLGALAALAGLGCLLGLIYMSMKSSQHSTNTLAAINQSDTKGELMALVDLASKTQQSVMRESLNLWDQQRRAAEAEHQRLAQERATLVEMAASMQANSRAVMEQNMHLVSLLAGQRAGLAAPGAPSAGGSVAPPAQTQLDNPFAHERLPSVNQTESSLVQVANGTNQKRWISLDSVTAKYTESVRFLAQRVLDECWNTTPLEYDAMMERLGYHSRKQLQKGLEMLSELGYCDPPGERGTTREWRDPRPAFQLSQEELEG